MVRDLGTYLSRGALPLGLPYTLSRAPLRRRAPFAWLTRCRSLASPVCAYRPVWVEETASTDYNGRNVPKARQINALPVAMKKSSVPLGE